MPTFSYKCKCNQVKEVVHKMIEAPAVKCECGGDMKKIITVAGQPVLKGAWFKQGY